MAMVARQRPPESTRFSVRAWCSGTRLCDVSADVDWCCGILSSRTRGKMPIPDSVAMENFGPQNRMALLSRLVWFTGVHHDFAPVGWASVFSYWLSAGWR